MGRIPKNLMKKPLRKLQQTGCIRELRVCYICASLNHNTALRREESGGDRADADHVQASKNLLGTVFSPSAVAFMPGRDGKTAEDGVELNQTQLYYDVADPDQFGRHARKNA